MTDELVTVPRAQWEGLLEDVADLKTAMGEVAAALGPDDEPDEVGSGRGLAAFMARGREKRARRSE